MTGNIIMIQHGREEIQMFWDRSKFIFPTAHASRASLVAPLVLFSGFPSTAAAAADATTKPRTPSIVGCQAKPTHSLSSSSSASTRSHYVLVTRGRAQHEGMNLPESRRSAAASHSQRTR